MDFADSLQVLEIASKLTADIEREDWKTNWQLTWWDSDTVMGWNESHFFYFHGLSWQLACVQKRMDRSWAIQQ